MNFSSLMKWIATAWSVYLWIAVATVGSAQTLGEALNATNLTWTTGGNAVWSVTMAPAYDGLTAVQSGGIGFNAESWLQTTVTGQTAVTFWWKVSSVTNAGFLEFYISGSQMLRISGQVDWQSHSVLVPTGQQTLRWRYTQSSTSTAYTNAGWLDGVSLVDPSPPQFLTQPTNQTVSAGDSTALIAQAVGSEPLAFQWQHDGSDVPGAVNPTLSLTNVQPNEAGVYTVAVTNQIGVITSQVATLTVMPSLPRFTLQPVSQATIIGSGATFTTAAKGSEPIAWQWFLDGQPLSGETSSNLVIANVQVTNGGNYTVVASNQVGMATSQVATLTIILAPIFTQQPLSQGAPLGSTVSFTAAAQGSGALSWQWYFNGNEVPGATTTRLLVTNVQASKFGNYWAIVTNSYGAATSAVATLSFSPVVVWGDNRYGEAIVPASAINVIALAGGDFHVVALRADESVIAWGTNYWSGYYFGQTDVPLAATNVVGIAAGSAHSLAVRIDGSVLPWGYILGGQQDVPPQVTNVVAQALGPGAQHAVSLLADGSVVEWGNPGWNLPNVPLTATNIVSVAAGAFHSLALRADGTLVTWGDSMSCQRAVPASATNVVAIACGWYHNLALRADGTVVGWGVCNNWNYGQANVPSSVTNAVAIACGGNHSLVLKADGKLVAWGDNSYGQTKLPLWATNLVAIAGTSYDSLALIGEGPPVLTTPLVNRSVLVGKTAYFRATAVGAIPLSYQWQLNGTDLPGATNAWLFVSNAQPAQAGAYSVSVTNVLGAVTSTPSFLMVLSKQASILPSSVLVSNGQLRFVASGPAGPVWRVQGSTNLVNWSDLATLTNVSGAISFSDPATNFAQRFYRLKLVP